MGSRSLLWMFLLVVGLGGFIFFYEKDLPSTDERRAQEKKILQLEADEVASLTVEWDGQKVRLEKDAPVDKDTENEDSAGDLEPPAWRLVTPFAGRADSSAVSSLVDSLIGLEHRRQLDDVDREELGLEDPAVKVTLGTSGGDSVLELGNELPASTDRVAEVEGGGVFVIAGGIFDTLTKDPGEWRDKKLFTADRGQIERVTLTAAGGEQVLLAKRGESFWIESPVADLADEEAITGLMTAVTGLQVATFLDEPLLDAAGLGLEPPRGVVDVVLRDSPDTFRLLLGDETATPGTWYGQVGDQRFEIDTELGEALAREASDWRSRDWTTAQVFKIDAVRVTDAQGETEVARQEADWKRGEDRIDYSLASNFLYAIADARGESLIDSSGDSSVTAGEPTLTLSLVTADGEEEMRLFAPREDGLSPAASSEREALLLLSAETVSALTDSWNAVRQAEPLVDEPEEEEAEPTAD